MHALTGKRILVIGLGLSGRSAAGFLLQRGGCVVGIDRNQNLIQTDESIKELCNKGMQVYHDDAMIDLWHKIGNFDLIVLSPGVPPSHPCVTAAKIDGIEVIGEIELACRDICVQPSKRCVGVTGTNGKTTVTLMIAHILNTAGIKAYALGNVGIPLTSAIDTEAQKEACVFVIELSSFQLEAFTRPCLDVGVLLNITPDHLDRYDSLEAYAAAKISMENCLRSEGQFFVEDKCFHEFQWLFKEHNYPTYGYAGNCWIHTDLNFIYLNRNQQFKLPDIYLGRECHDVENIMAAYAVCDRLGVSAQKFVEGLRSFKKPPHRIEFVRTVKGIHYYDDSKGTNIDAVVRAVAAMENEVVLVAGGVDKGFPYVSWLKDFKGKVKAICAIGQAAPKIKQDLNSHIPVTLCESLESAVLQATSHALSGYTVLLSPGCASFDMFTDYAHRGQEFQRIVNAL